MVQKRSREEILPPFTRKKISSPCYRRGSRESVAADAPRQKGSRESVPAKTPEGKRSRESAQTPERKGSREVAAAETPRNKGSRESVPTHTPEKIESREDASAQTPGKRGSREQIIEQTHGKKEIREPDSESASSNVISITREMQRRGIPQGSKEMRYTVPSMLTCIVTGLIIAVSSVVIVLALWNAEIESRPPPLLIDDRYKHSRPENDRCSRICTLPDFLEPRPPLVIISLDGYAKSYLSRGLQTAFARIAKCGVTSEEVYPCFPSLTAPCHETIVTGRHPDHHGIVANRMWDRSISYSPENIFKANPNEYFRVEPIWSIYKRITHGKAATIAWLGSAHESTYYLQPDYVVPYSEDITLKDTLEKILEWLRMDSSDRPGIIMAYSKEPDRTGHKTFGPKLNATLEHIDETLDDFLEIMQEEGFLGCVNLVIVSDHGMARIRDHEALDDYIGLDSVEYTLGALAQLYLTHPAQNLKSLTEPLACQTHDHIRIFTKKTMPIRYHYTNSSRIGDVVLLGHGTHITRYNHEIDWNLQASHGFDYIEPDMRTIMYARGPSFKEAYVLPSFHQVDYMNLWLKLLRLPLLHNDGDPYFMDLALVNQSTPITSYESLQQCNGDRGRLGRANYTTCGSCIASDMKLVEQKMRCRSSLISGALSMEAESGKDFCTMYTCSELAVRRNVDGEVFSVALAEMYTKDDSAFTLSRDCSVQIYKGRSECVDNNTTDGDFRYVTLSAHSGGVLAKENNVLVLLRSSFIKNIFEPLNAYTLEAAQRFGRLVAITGSIYNNDYDGAFSKAQPSTDSPTHIFRILIACTSEWAFAPHCMKDEDTMVLSFILPTMQKDINCLTRNELLLDYTARIKDIETMSGLRFNFTNIPHMLQVVLKLHINTKLW